MGVPAEAGEWGGARRSVIPALDTCGNLDSMRIP